MSDAPPPDVQAASSRFRPSRALVLDLSSAYLASIARVGSAAVIVALLFRMTHAHYVAAFVLVRSMLSVLTYAFAGWQPSALRLLGEAEHAPLTQAEVAADERPGSTVLDYRTPVELARQPPSLSASLFLTSAVAVLCGYALVELYAAMFIGLHGSPITRQEALPRFVAVLGIGLLWRVASEPAGAMLQARGRLWLDNLLIIASEAAWVALACGTMLASDFYTERFRGVAVAYWVSGAALFACRWGATVQSRSSAVGSFLTWPSGTLSARFLLAAFAISIGHFADFLYAPMNVLLINQALNPDLIDEYGPALQIDAALLLTVSAVAVVVLPRVSRAAARGDVRRVRRIYVTAMLASLGLLVVGATIITLFRRPLLQAWLGQQPPLLVEILPFVLVHTVIGGTAGVGRAVLLGMGRFRAYTVSAVVGGVANVALAIVFAVVFDWGLRGIIFATVLAVTFRCAIWMPWYVLRATR